jgi:hypothetical protein
MIEIPGVIWEYQSQQPGPSTWPTPAGRSSTLVAVGVGPRAGGIWGEERPVPRPRAPRSESEPIQTPSAWDLHNPSRVRWPWWGGTVALSNGFPLLAGTLGNLDTSKKP